jgi:hypothetical protein
MAVSNESEPASDAPAVLRDVGRSVASADLTILRASTIQSQSFLLSVAAQDLLSPASLKTWQAILLLGEGRPQ